jgi:hypothetical protein
MYQHVYCVAVAISDNSFIGPNPLLSGRAQDGGQKLWLHDLVQCVQSPGAVIRQAGGEPRGQLLVESIKRGIRQALVFVFDKTITINGKVLTRWSAVRAAIKGEIVNDHLSLLRSVCGMSDLGQVPWLENWRASNCCMAFNISNCMPMLFGCVCVKR